MTERTQRRSTTPWRYIQHKSKPWYVNAYRRVMREAWKRRWISR